MLKKKLKKYMPDRNKLLNSKSMKIFGKILHDPNLWHLNRNSVANAFAVGLMCAWIPVPFQMALAALGAITFHANLPLAIAWVWLTNPITMPPLFFFAYKIGALALGLPLRSSFKFQLDLDWFTTALKNTWQPFLLGCAICGVVSAIIGYFGIKLAWRYFTVKNWKLRAKKRATRNVASTQKK